MKLGMAIGYVCVLGLYACSASETEGSRSEAERLLEALERGMLFENGERRDGDIPAAEGADGVNVAASESALMLVPGSASIMPLEVDNPDADNPVAATLLQFEDSESHVAVPADGSGAGSGGTTMLENPFTIADDICTDLCNRVYTTQLTFAIEREDGSVTATQSIDLVLDCRETGDAEACDPNGAPGGSGGGGGGTDDAGGGGMPDSGTPPEPDAGPSSADAGTPPQLISMTPTSAGPATDVMLSVTGLGFASGATVLVDSAPMATTVIDDMALTATVPAAATSNPGSLAVVVANDVDDVNTWSNVLYLQITALPGAPVIHDYSPDNGVAGDTILIIASNLATQPFTIEDANGTPIEPGTLATISWPTVGGVDTVEVVLPDGIVTGPITVSNDIGSYRGKIFSVGMNLTRITDTLIESSSEYNTSNWSRLSGADNNLATSFFTANGDCASDVSCTMVPWFQVTFTSNQTVAKIAMRGNREYASGYDFIRGTFEILDASDEVLWGGDYDLPEPDRDIDITITPAVSGARAVRFTSIADESTEPGFAELQAFGP